MTKVKNWLLEAGKVGFQLCMFFLAVRLLGVAFNHPWTTLFLYLAGLAGFLWYMRRELSSEDFLPYWMSMTWFVWAGFGFVMFVGDQLDRCKR